jgi:hypothetical protein
MSLQHSPNKGGIRSAISQLIPDGSVVIELGDRIGLDSLEKKFRILTFDSNESNITSSNSDKHMHVPIVASRLGGTEWYDPELLASVLPEDYDLLFINGPEGRYGKFGLLENINLFNSEIPIILSDTIRENEAGIARELAYKLNRPLYVFWNFSIISPSLLTRLQVATIQREAVRVLEGEKDSYLDDFFSSTMPLRTISRQEWHERIPGYKSKDEAYFRLKSSISYRIGRLLTSPFRFIFRFFDRK